jgi:hypothetical protein
MCDANDEGEEKIEQKFIKSVYRLMFIIILMFIIVLHLQFWE